MFDYGNKQAKPIELDSKSNMRTKSDVYSMLDKLCKTLCDGMDAAQYKEYVFALIFFKCVSDKSAAGTKGVAVPDNSTFGSLFASISEPGIGKRINDSLLSIEKANEKLQGVVSSVNFDSEKHLGKTKQRQDMLANALTILNGIDFSDSENLDNDFMGNAYEYVLRHFSTTSGQNKGQFYTPPEVSLLMAELLGAARDGASVYDPTCGSGSLILKVASNNPHAKLKLYGQEKDHVATNLAKINMILRDHFDAKIADSGNNTLSNPEFVVSDTELMKFDMVVANPPFSNKTWQDGFELDKKTKEPIDPFGRFEYGYPPRLCGDFAFILHMIHSMKDDGGGALIISNGALFRQGREGEIRKRIVDSGVIESVITLPEALFYGTTIPATLIVFNKQGASERKHIFMIDASKGFESAKNQNKLRYRDMYKITNTILNEKELPRYSRKVPLEEIAEEDYKLSSQRYIDTFIEEPKISLVALTYGGVPKFNIDEHYRYWDLFGYDETFGTLYTEKPENPNLPTTHKYYDPIFVEGETDHFGHKRIDALLSNSKGYADFVSETKDEIDDWLSYFAKEVEKTSPGKVDDLMHLFAMSLHNKFEGEAFIDGYEMYQVFRERWNSDFRRLTLEALSPDSDTSIAELCATIGQVMKEVIDTQSAKIISSFIGILLSLNRSYANPMTKLIKEANDAHLKMDSIMKNLLAANPDDK